jgi:hypothetical protein
MAAVLFSWPLFRHYGHGSGYYGHYGRSMTTMAMVWTLWQRYVHHDCGMVIMAVARSLWPWYSPYSFGAAPMAVVWPLRMWCSSLWLWCHCYGLVLAQVGQFMTLLCCQQLQPYPHFCHQASRGHQSRMDRQPRGH